MKKILAFVLVLVLIVSFCGCRGVKLLEEDNVKNVSVTFYPGDEKYSFSKDDAKAVVDYLNNLKITKYDKSLDQHVGIGWDISVEYNNGETVDAFIFNDVFIRVEHGQWYKISDDEEQSFRKFLRELDN